MTSPEIIRVLLLDENPVDTETVRIMFRKYAFATFELHTVGSARECTDALNKGSFDLLLLDYNLPGQDGLTFLRRLKEESDAPPVIMLTGTGNERVAVEAMRSGASDYLRPRIQPQAATSSGWPAMPSS